MGARFGWRGPEKVVHRDLRKVPENSAPEPRTAGGQSRQRRLQRGPRLTFFLMLSVPLYLSDSSACHLLISSFTSVRGLLGEPSSSLTFQFSRDIALKLAQGKLCPL